MSNCNGKQFYVGKLWYYHCPVKEEFVRVPIQMRAECPVCGRPRLRKRPAEVRVRKVTQVLFKSGNKAEERWLTLRNEEA